jgi:hypothetical protein
VGKRYRRLGFLDETPDELFITCEFVAYLFDHEPFLESARTPQRGQHDARHAPSSQLSLKNVFAEYLGIHSVFDGAIAS